MSGKPLDDMELQMHRSPSYGSIQMEEDLEGDGTENKTRQNDQDSSIANIGSGRTGGIINMGMTDDDEALPASIITLQPQPLGNAISEELNSQIRRRLSKNAAVCSSSSGSNVAETKKQEAIICTKCSSKLCDSCQKVLDSLTQRDEECREFYDRTPFQVALRRMPALVITMILELAGGGVIAELSETLSQFILLASFIPVISALSGNLGLQTSANIVRGLATGNICRSRFLYEVRKEIFTGLFCSIAIAVLLGSVGACWVHLDQDPAEIRFKRNIDNYELIFGGVIMLGAFLSMLISSTNGSLTPFVANLLRLDPAKFSGPLETAFQDIAGVGFLLGLATAILLPLSPKPILTSASTCSNHP